MIFLLILGFVFAWACASLVAIGLYRLVDGIGRLSGWWA